jgi:hypothetical protein
MIGPDGFRYWIASRDAKFDREGHPILPREWISDSVPEGLIQIYQELKHTQGGKNGDRTR